MLAVRSFKKYALSCTLVALFSTNLHPNDQTIKPVQQDKKAARVVWHSCKFIVGTTGALASFVFSPTSSRVDKQNIAILSTLLLACLNTTFNSLHAVRKLTSANPHIKPEKTMTAVNILKIPIGILVACLGTIIAAGASVSKVFHGDPKIRRAYPSGRINLGLFAVGICWILIGLDNCCDGLGSLLKSNKKMLADHQQSLIDSISQRLENDRELIHQAEHMIDS